MADTLRDLIERARDHLEMAPVRQRLQAADDIKTRATAASSQIDGLKAAVDKYQSNPDRYAPQVDNIKHFAKQLEQLGKVISRFADKM